MKCVFHACGGLMMPVVQSFLLMLLSMMPVFAVAQSKDAESKELSIPRDGMIHDVQVCDPGTQVAMVVFAYTDTFMGGPYSYSGFQVTDQILECSKETFTTARGLHKLLMKYRLAMKNPKLKILNVMLLSK